MSDYLYVRARQIHQPGGPLPIGKSTFYDYIARGWLPQGRLLSPRMRVWKLTDVLDAFDRLGAAEA